MDLTKFKSKKLFSNMLGNSFLLSGIKKICQWQVFSIILKFFERFSAFQDHIHTHKSHNIMHMPKYSRQIRLQWNAALKIQ